MDPILEILSQDARTSPEDIARMLGREAGEVREAIRKLEDEGVILGYRTLVNDELVRDERGRVRALIEVKVSPSKDVGFDRVAERLYSFPDVISCTLLSGTYDLLLVVEGPDMLSVARFVAEKLSPAEDVRGTVTHFILKKYKQDGVILKHREDGRRMAISY